ncbi:MAG TPA: GGDEF domain-containing protein [Planctomycetes bacterium]|nr:GGDEF domain-containing protein [Planctomycetota bacterium]
MLTATLILIIASFLLGYSVHRYICQSSGRSMDPVTGLPTRAAFQHVLQRQLAMTDPTTLILIDLNGFKLVNDRYGHLQGDQLLATVARQIKQRTAAYGTLFRWGGDEFAVILNSNCTDRAAPDLELHSFFDQAEFHLGDDTVTLSCSVGWASAELNDTVDTLFQRADESLYRHKPGHQTDS